MLKRPRLATRRRPQQPRARKTWGDIVEAAFVALRREGPKVTMTRIAEISGYSIGTVYQYFPDRRALFCELMQQVADSNAAALMAATPQFQASPLEEGVRCLLAPLVRAHAEQRAVVTVVLREVVPTLADDEVEDLGPGFARVLAKQLEARRHELRECDFELAAMFILQTLEGLLHAAALDRPELLESPVFLDELVALVVGYMTPR